MTYTSGTTGRPRGVRRPFGEVPPDHLADNFTGFLKLFGIGPAGVHLVTSPMYHTAVINWCLYSLHYGHTAVLMGKWTAEGTLDCIAKYRVTHSHMVPTHFNRMLALPEDVRSAADTSSITHLVHGAAPCPIPVKHAMLEWFGPVVYEYYAASEGGGTTATPQQWLQKPGTVGAPWPISTIRVLNDDLELLPPGEIGTVWIRMGEHKFEYHGDEEKTQKAWNEGFFTVGDAGYLDEDGFLYLVDRKADMIISGGVNIYPAEIECELITHPRVVDCAVFGIPNDDWGEEVKAVVEVSGEADDDLREAILSFCRERVAGYKCPRSIDFVEELPRDPNGKLYKRRLRDPYWEGRDRAI
jgi:long-chain acyl-CoA synthetase